VHGQLERGICVQETRRNGIEKECSAADLRFVPSSFAFYPDLGPELLAYLPGEGFLRRLAGLHLAAGKLPQAAMTGPGRAPGQEDPRIGMFPAFALSRSRFDQCRDYDDRSARVDSG